MMLNQSLVSYSDSENSDRDGDPWLQTYNSPQTNNGNVSRDSSKGGKKPEQRFYVVPGARGSSLNSLSPPSISPTGKEDNVFTDTFANDFNSKSRKVEKQDSKTSVAKQISLSGQKSRPSLSLPVFKPTCIEIASPDSVRDIPLPEESSPGESINSLDSPCSETRKAKHAAKPLYVPPPRRHSTPARHESKDESIGETENVNSVTVTPTSKKKVSPGSGIKRKWEQEGSKNQETPENPSTENKHQRKKRLYCEVDLEKETAAVRKTVTLKPFWMCCPPPSRTTEAYRCELKVDSPQPLSLPFEVNLPDINHLESGPVSLPEMSVRYSTKRESSSSIRYCSVSDYSGCSSADVSPATSMSSLELSRAESPMTSRRHSQGSANSSISRSRINSLPAKLKRQIFDAKSVLNKQQNSSYWKTNFRNRFCGFTNPFIDSHCHLDFLFNREGFRGTFRQYKEEHQDTFPQNFAGCVAVFCEPSSFNPKYGLWKKVSIESDVWVSMGCHPKSAENYTGRVEDGLRACLQEPKVIAAGEFGLDYSGRFKETADIQKDVFVRQLHIALSLDKPLVIHCRKAEDDTFSIMERIVPKHTRIHRHCFTEDFNEASRWINTFPNLYVGLTPLVTYKSAKETHDIARKVPLERLLLETDAPYFVPHSIPRSEMSLSHPGLAITVAERVAYLRNIPVTQVLDASRDNTRKMYGI